MVALVCEWRSFFCDFWHIKSLANRPIAELNFVFDDPLSKSVAVRSWPVSILMNEWVGIWRWFNSLNDGQSLVAFPFMNTSRRSIAHSLIWSQKIFMKVSPARFVLFRGLPYLPAVACHWMLPFFAMKSKQPIMISNDSDKSWYFRCSKLNFDHVPLIESDVLGE